jgi:hypothetical protein
MSRQSPFFKDLLQLQPLDARRLDLGFCEETLIFQLQNFGNLIRGKDVPSLGDPFGGFCKCSTSLTKGETKDLPSIG